jgi:hypothetical protein
LTGACMNSLQPAHIELAVMLSFRWFIARSFAVLPGRHIDLAVV